MWSGFEFRYKLQNLLRVACMTAMSLHPTKCSKRSYWTRYVSQADILTYGKFFLLSKSILEIGTGNDWPYLRNTAWQSLSLFFGFTRPSCLRALDATRVTRAFRSYTSLYSLFAIQPRECFVPAWGIPCASTVKFSSRTLGNSSIPAMTSGCNASRV